MVAMVQMNSAVGVRVMIPVQTRVVREIAREAILERATGAHRIVILSGWIVIIVERAGMSMLDMTAPAMKRVRVRSDLQKESARLAKRAKMMGETRLERIR